MLMRVGIWAAILAGVALFMAAFWMLLAPTADGDTTLRALLAAETQARWAVLAVLGALLGNVLLFLNLRIAADATQAALVAAEAAKEAVDHARQTSQIELRPYMVFDADEWTPLHDDAPGVITYWRLKVTWRNTGRTPARNVCLRLMYADGGADVDWSRFVFPDPLDTQPQVGSVSAGNTISMTTEIPIQTMQSVFAGERRLMFYGWIEYDGFADAPRHRSECAMHVRVLTSPDKMEAEFDHAFSDRHNGDDESCMYRPRTMISAKAPQRMAPRGGEDVNYQFRD
ncbi:MAG: hypothetical protein J0M36_03250 [Caulobacterales bacterium]|nr:hypothetical protein [Caulobacterales bacterium]